MATNDPTRWYDLIAPLYDLAITGVYTRARKATVRQLRLAPGQTVLDVACGTGENFRYLGEAIGPSGTLIGTDYSEGMLAQARRKIERNRWANVRLLRADARTLSLDTIRSALSLPDLRFHRIVCTLGFSVVPDWETVFERTWEILEPGGRYAIMDWYSPRQTLFTKFLSLIAAGEINRRWWEPLEQRAEDFERESMFRGLLFVMSGTNGTP
ncbi:MAG: class I SAM-dependent methyltransferase [Anaerolineae bacterium]